MRPETRKKGWLSPLVRGNLPWESIREGEEVAIPACAGEPLVGVSGQTITKGYPRLYGGTASFAGALPAFAGLSPPVRGNRASLQFCDSPRRSIPACVGEPTIAIPDTRTLRVYPRLCGGTHHRHSRHPNLAGLSPPVWGNPPSPFPTPEPCGSIPACAGEPPLALVVPGCSEVYPRLCGGTRVQGRRPRGPGGLSPPVRGNQELILKRLNIKRSIPACAGEPVVAPRLIRGFEVYPRLCGGTIFRKQMRPTANGLSPPVRGNLSLADLPAAARGSIPACAGEPPPPSIPPARHQVYPRLCGGTREGAVGQNADRGLSPPVRGNL